MREWYLPRMNREVRFRLENTSWTKGSKTEFLVYGTTSRHFKMTLKKSIRKSRLPCGLICILPYWHFRTFIILVRLNWQCISSHVEGASFEWILSKFIIDSIFWSTLNSRLKENDFLVLNCSALCDSKITVICFECGLTFSMNFIPNNLIEDDWITCMADEFMVLTD